jgi:hypothetical protein
MARQTLESFVDQEGKVLLMRLERNNWMNSLVSAVVGGNLFVE